MHHSCFLGSLLEFHLCVTPSPSTSHQPPLWLDWVVVPSKVLPKLLDSYQLKNSVLVRRFNILCPGCFSGSNHPAITFLPVYRSLQGPLAREALCAGVGMCRCVHVNCRDPEGKTKKTQPALSGTYNSDAEVGQNRWKAKAQLRAVMIKWISEGHDGAR